MNKTIVFICFLTGISLSAFSQNARGIKSHVNKASLYGKNFIKPAYTGGSDEMYEYIAKNIHYPDMAKEANIQGKVMVQFMVNEKGNLSQIKVKKGIGGGCDEEAVRVIKNMPKWKPATYNHKPTKAIVDLPIVFKLK